MDYVVALFDEKLWTDSGSEWCRSVKSRGYTGVLLDNGLPQSALEKIEQLNFRVLSVSEYKNKLDVFRTFVKHVEPEDSWLYLSNIDMINDDLSDFFSNRSLVCRELLKDKDVDISALVSLKERVKFSSLLDSTKLCSADIIGGGFYGWNSFLGLYDFMLTNSIIHSDATELVLNVFSIYFPNLIRHGGVALEEQNG